jgi:predicted DNA-binding transcriptional regulator AlpA
MSSKLYAGPFQSTADLDALMSVRQTCAFLGGVSKMSLYRWWNDPTSGFPKPFKVGQKNFWVRRDVVAFRDAQRQKSEQAGAPVPRTGNPTSQVVDPPCDPDSAAMASSIEITTGQQRTQFR